MRNAFSSLNCSSSIRRVNSAACHSLHAGFTLSIVVEIAEEIDQFVLVLEKDIHNGLVLVGVGYKDLMIEVNGRYTRMDRDLP